MKKVVCREGWEDDLLAAKDKEILQQNVVEIKEELGDDEIIPLTADELTIV